MMNSNFKLSFRALWKNKSFSLINILGLAVGIAASLLIFLVIHYEKSYDTYQSRYDRIARMVTIDHNPTTGEVTGSHSMAPRPLADALRRDFPGLEKVAAMQGVGSAQFYIPVQGQEEKKYKVESGVFFAEQSLYDIFDFSWIVGNTKGLEEPNTTVVNESIARRFFGTPEGAIGKTVQMWSYRVPLRITGVFKDLPENTDVPVCIGASYPTFRNLIGEKDWGDWRSLGGGTQLFALLSPNQEIAKLQAQSAAFVKRNYREEQEHALTRIDLRFQPMREVHVDKRFDTLKKDNMSPQELWGMMLIGTFLLMVACVNFINLATAQSINRAKEIGVRKVLGSDRAQLIKQFLQETAIITALAVVLGSLMALIATPYLSTLMGKQLSMNIFHSPAILLFLVIIGLVVTLLAGFYPALVLSGFNPLMAIKSRISNRTVGGISLRRGLVVFQFVIAQLLVIGTLVVIKQMSFFRNKSLGFEKEAVVMVDLPSDSSLKMRYPYLVAEMNKLKGVEATSLCWTAPASNAIQYSDFYFNNDTEKQPYSAKRLYGDSAYYNLFKMSLAAGRLPFPSDTVRELMINETLVKKLGLKSSEDVLGKTLRFTGGQAYPIVGVVKDFNDNSLRDGISPIVLSPDFNGYGTLALRLRKDEVNATLKAIEKRFKEIYPTYMYDLTFVDDSIRSFYSNEALIAKLFQIFAILAIFISSLGLYGLVSFMAVQKTKEVGIRKVLGASIQSILYLFSREFTILIGIAFLIATPAAYYFMHRWLSGFHYHTDMGWEIFLLAIVLSLVIAWLTVGYKAVRAATANPVKSLRAE
ncbi:duplicated orphan permease [Chitinophaga sp. YR627]|uniref:FtsX-like permease family protein n=1 Tax=Chitinophaga sp. YR627 TaxID=1881041 RepID=UPI0008E4FEA9|nr:FtsX-like permease family protein [Chitinophaga sp. YR627]SFN75399.1 duplicated orphan permease [Chitinophaga sp. YR627]